MNPFRKWIDPGGRQLARRLDQLRDTFNDLAGRLRSTVASAVGEAFGNLIQDALLQALHGLGSAVAPCDRPALPGNQQRWSGAHDRVDRVDEGIPWRQPVNDRDSDPWFEERFEDDEEAGQDPSQSPTPSSSVPVIVVAAGLQAASLWLRYWTGSRKLLTTLAAGLLTGGLAYAVPSLTSSILNLAGSALQLGALNNVHVPNNTLLASLGFT